MKETFTFLPNGYYLFESLADSRNCYFESKKEIEIFKKKLKRYLHGYVKIHKLYISKEGYQILLKIRSKPVLLKKYLNSCMKKVKDIRTQFLKEPWRIVSEQFRIFHSVYVKSVNKSRGREGVLVKHRFKKYYFEGVEEFQYYHEEMEIRKKDITNQSNRRYRVSKQWVDDVNWALVRGVKFVESFINKEFRNYVVSKLISHTLSSHHPSP
jgi:hypothetical protein